MESWVDQVRGWTANYFSVTEGDGDVVALLGKVAESLEQLGDVEVLDVTFLSDPDEAEATMTVYFRFEEADNEEP
jgi:hypothetical protein